MTSYDTVCLQVPTSINPSLSLCLSLSLSFIYRWVKTLVSFCSAQNSRDCACASALKIVLPIIFTTRKATSTNSFGPPVMASNFPCNTATHGPGGTLMELLELFARLLATCCMPQIFLRFVFQGCQRSWPKIKHDKTTDLRRKKRRRKRPSTV